MSNYQTEQHDNRWRQRTQEIAEVAGHWVSEASDTGGNPMRCVHPTPAQKKAHTALLRYHRQLAPKADKLTDVGHEGDNLWDHVVTRVPVPASGSVEVGTTNEYGEFNAEAALSRAEVEQKPVNPSTLVDEWRDGNLLQLEVVATDRHRGKVREYVTRQLVLPPSAATQLLTHLDKCLNTLGWLPEADLSGVTAEWHYSDYSNPENIREMVEEAKANGSGGDDDA